jgi:hypothetical protein
MVCKSSLFLSWLLHKNIKGKMRIYVTNTVFALFLGYPPCGFIVLITNVFITNVYTLIIFTVTLIWKDRKQRELKIICPFLHTVIYQNASWHDNNCLTLHICYEDICYKHDEPTIKIDWKNKYYIYHGSYELTYLNQRIQRMSLLK